MNAPANTLWQLLMRAPATAPLGDFLDGPHGLRSMPIAMRELDEAIARMRANEARRLAAASACTQPTSSTPARVAPRRKPTSAPAPAQQPAKPFRARNIGSRDQ